MKFYGAAAPWRLGRFEREMGVRAATGATESHKNAAGKLFCLCSRASALPRFSCAAPRRAQRSGRRPNPPLPSLTKRKRVAAAAQRRIARSPLIESKNITQQSIKAILPISVVEENSLPLGVTTDIVSTVSGINRVMI